MRSVKRLFAPTSSSSQVAQVALPHETVERKASRRGGKMPGMLICVVFGHVVDWGPCPRCDRRAPG